MTSQRILVIEDNVETAHNIKLYMQHNHFNCDLVHTGTQGVTQFRQNTYDLVILDRMLPDLNGVAVCEAIRATSNVPIIMLTAKVSGQDLVDGLASGADEYVKKPYSNKELVARVKAHLRRNQASSTDDVDQQTVGPFIHDKKTCVISLGEQPLALTKTEYLLFECLLNAPGQVFSREQLFATAFGTSRDSIDRTVDVHLHNLRSKIVKAGLKPHGIVAVYGMGYKLVLG